MTQSIKIYDPRKDEDRLFGPVSGRSFSSREEKLFVIECPPRYAPFRQTGHILSEMTWHALTLFEGVGFFCMYAAPKIIEESLADDAIWADNSALEYFSPCKSEVAKRLQLFDHLEYGGCSLGISTAEFPTLDSTPFNDLDDLVFFGGPSNVKSLLHYSESGHATLLTRYYQGIDRDLSELYKEGKPGA